MFFILKSGLPKETAFNIVCQPEHCSRNGFPCGNKLIFTVFDNNDKACDRKHNKAEERNFRDHANDDNNA